MRSFRILTVIALALVTSSVQARWFEIEVLLFSRNIDPQQVDESWSQQLPPSRLPAKRDLLADWWQQQGPCSAIDNGQDITPQAPAQPTLTREQLDTHATVNEATDISNADSTMDSTIAAQAEQNCSSGMPQDWPTEVAANSSANGSTLFYLMPRSAMKLSSQWQKLQHDARYKPLLHFVWREDVQPRRTAKPIVIRAGHNFAGQFLSTGWQPRFEQPTDTSPMSISPGPIQAAQKPLWGLEGSLQISLNTWLRVDTVLTLHEPGLRQRYPAKMIENEDNSIAPMPQSAIREPFLYSYQLDQFRRVRSSEIHYFDHPLMGMIIQIRPIDDVNSETP